jgi:hypothetical protein
MATGLLRGGSSSPGIFKNYTASGSYPASYPVCTGGGGGPFPEETRSGREANQSLPISAEAKKTRFHTSTPPYAFMALWLLVKCREHLAFQRIYYILATASVV